jgi:hypothetical protein
VSNSTFVTGLPDTTAPPTTGNRFGWFSESSYNGTFASAAWTVQVRSDDNRAQITGEPILNVYKCTEKSFVSGTWTFLFQTTEASAADWWVNATATISWTETPAQITLSDEFLFVNVFCHEHSSASGFLHHFRMEGSALSEAQVSKIVTSDFTSPASPTRGLVSWAELEAPGVATRGLISFTEIETPIALTRGLVSWSELESPIALTRGLISWSEQEVPSALPDPTRGLIGWAEQEAPFVQTRGRVSFSEFEAPIAATRGRISFTEFEAAFVLTRGLMSFTELETPLAPTRGLSSWQEFETPLSATRGQISFAEFSVGSGDVVTTTPIPVFGYFVTPLRRHRNCQP